MQIASILDRIDNGSIALPEFQRGYVWGRPQVRNLVASLYRRFPVGSLLLWQTATEGAPARGSAQLQPGFVSLLLDGQQRITSLYGLIRGEAPPFFDGQANAFTDLRFHVDEERFGFYVPVTMRNDPLWIDVSGAMRDLDWAFEQLPTDDLDAFRRRTRRLTRLHGIRDVHLHAEEITGPDKTVDVVVELFNQVNSGGTKLSKGDLALAKLCASWPEARTELKGRLSGWSNAGYHFSLDWLLRNINAVVTGRAEFSEFEKVSTVQFQEGLIRTERAVNTVLNLTSTRLGLDHDRVLGAVGAIPLMSRFVADRDFRLTDQRTADRLLFWYVHALLWGRYAGSTETALNVDLQQIRHDRPDDEALAALVGELRRQRGDLRVTAQDFSGWSRGARFYPLLYMLTRVQGARDLGSGLELRNHLLGQHASLEVHHVFPKALLYRHDFARSEVNAIANFTFLTLDTNRALADAEPSSYLTDCESRHPGALASHWIPGNPELWEPARYLDFLAERRSLLAGAANQLLEDLWGGRIEEGAAENPLEHGAVQVPAVEDDEAREIAYANAWAQEQGFVRGVESLALLAMDGLHEEAVLDLAWPEGLRYGQERIALLIDEPAEVQAAASRHGYRFFTSVVALQAHAESEEGAA